MEAHGPLECRRRPEERAAANPVLPFHELPTRLLAGGEFSLDSLMLDGAFTSPKIRRLAAILDVPWPHALGLAGLLWRFTAKHSPTGEVGRHEDDDIVTALEWPGEARVLLEAFVRSRLLDRVDGPARYVVHDWPDHAPRYVLASLKRRGLDWSPHYAVSPVPTADVTTEGTADATTLTPTPTPTLPHTHTHTPRGASVGAEWDEEAKNIWSLWPAPRRSAEAACVGIIKVSLRQLVESGLEPKDAAERIRRATERDARHYNAEVEAGRLRSRFVPNAITYFREERWADDRQAGNDIDEQIRRIGGDMGGQLAPPS